MSTSRHSLSLDGLGRAPEQLGMLTFYRKRRFSEAETQTLKGLLSVLVFPLHNALTHQRSLIMALVDPLTQVGNRHALAREICLAQRQGQPLALLVLDIDHFKSINDTHSHSLGDRALALIAERLRRAIETEVLEIDAQTLSMTVSIGISAYSNDHGERPDGLFERADDALYQAKARGRNCIVIDLPNSDRRQAI